MFIYTLENVTFSKRKRKTLKITQLQCPVFIAFGSMELELNKHVKFLWLHLIKWVHSFSFHRLLIIIFLCYFQLDFNVYYNITYEEAFQSYYWKVWYNITYEEIVDHWYRVLQNQNILFPHQHNDQGILQQMPSRDCQEFPACNIRCLRDD